MKFVPISPIIEVTIFIHDRRCGPRLHAQESIA